MKFLIFPLVLAFAASVQARETLVTCQIQNFSKCENCATRVPASCVGHEYIGSLALTLKPAKIQWQISNSENGTEKRLTVENKNLSLKDFKIAKSLKSLALQNKVKLESGETVSLLSFQVPAQTPLYKSYKGKEVAVAEMKPQPVARAIASITPTAKGTSSLIEGPVAGGVKRAQQLKEKK